MENRDHLLRHTPFRNCCAGGCSDSPERVALREKEFGCWNNYTWDQYYERCARPALGLEQIGFEQADTIAIISDNIPEMLVMAIGAQAVGGDFGRRSTKPVCRMKSPASSTTWTSAWSSATIRSRWTSSLRCATGSRRCSKVIYEDPRGMRDYRSDDWFMFHRRAATRWASRRSTADPERFDRLVDRGQARRCLPPLPDLRHHRAAQGRHDDPSQLHQHGASDHQGRSRWRKPTNMSRFCPLPGSASR